MVNVKEFGVIRNKVKQKRAGLLSNISDNKFLYKTMVANAIHVEEDGHLYQINFSGHRTAYLTQESAGRVPASPGR